MEHLSVVIITLNEEQHISTCLESVRDVADEILVLDSFSTDQTRDICLKAGATFHQHTFDGYVSQKNRALGMASHPLVLSLDGDEALTGEAVKDILAIKANRQADGYSFKRLNNYCGRWMKHTSMYPDRKIRLFDKRKASWGGYDPHDQIIAEPEAVIVPLQSALLHWVFANKKEHASKLIRFASIAAKAYYEKDRQSAGYQKYLHAGWRFFDEWVRRGGWIEGKLGWQFSCLSARYVYLKYKNLQEEYAKRSG